MKHTAGRWHWMRDDDGNGTLYGSDGGGPQALPCTVIARAPINVPRWSAEHNAMRWANSELIAAAPALYDFVIQYLYSEHGVCKPWHFAAPYSPEQLREKAETLLAQLDGIENE